MQMVRPGAAVLLKNTFSTDQMTNYEQNLQWLEALRQIVGDGQLRFNVDYSLGLAVPLLHLAKLKSAEQLAAVTALQALATNDASRAESNLVLAIDLVHSLDNGRMLISELVRIALAKIAVGATWQGLQSGMFTEAQLAELEEKWSKVDLLQNIAPALRMERAEDLLYLAELRKTNELAGGMISFTSSSSAGSSDGGVISVVRDKAREWYESHPRYWKWRSTWSYDEELTMLQQFDV